MMIIRSFKKFINNIISFGSDYNPITNLSHHYDYYADPNTIRRFKMSDGEIERAFDINIEYKKLEDSFWKIIDEANKRE
jgi:hypothetical protein